jgi:nitroreductase
MKSHSDIPHRRLLEIVSARTSCRAYGPDPVADEDIKYMPEAARLAPSACNKQPWRFVVVRPAGTRRSIVENGLLPGLKMTWALEAPVLIVVGCDALLPQLKA